MAALRLGVPKRYQWLFTLNTGCRRRCNQPMAGIQIAEASLSTLMAIIPASFHDQFQLPNTRSRFPDQPSTPLSAADSM